MTFEIQKDDIGLNHVSYTKMNNQGVLEKHYMCCTNDEKLKQLYRFLDAHFNQAKSKCVNTEKKIIKHDFKKRVS